MSAIYVEGALVSELLTDEHLVEGMLLSEDGFPAEFPIVFIKTTSGTIQLSVVAEDDAPTGMGGVLKVAKSGVAYAIYLVETTNPKASPIRIKTTTGVKALRIAN